MSKLNFMFKVVLMLCLVNMLVVAQQKEKEQVSTGLATEKNHVEKTKTISLTGSSYDVKSSYLEEGFEQTTFPPQGWTLTDVLGAKKWVRSTTGPNSGVACANSDYESTGGEDWLITPSIPVVANMDFSFYAKKSYASNYPPDSLYVLVSTTDNAVASFTSQLVGLNVNSLTTAYQQLSYSLSAFVGQTIYIAFKHVNTDGNGCSIDDVVIGVPPANDAGMVSLDFNGLVSPGALTPKVTVKNYGTAANSFDITLNIGNIYSSTKQVSNLAGGTSTEVTFNQVTLEAGEYAVECYTSLTNDEVTSNDSIISTLFVADARTLYGYASGTVRFESTNPGLFTRTNSISGTDFLSGSANTGNGVIYSVYYSSSQVVLWDTTTGTLTNVGVLTPPTGANWLGLTYDPVTEKIYGCAADNSGTILAEINMQTLTYTTLATLPGFAVIAIASNGDGNIYGVDLISDVLGKYVIATNTFELVGSIGFNANYSQSMEFDYASGKLFYAAYNGGNSLGELRIVDINTGIATLVAVFEDGAEVDGLFASSSPVVPVELTSFEASKVDNSICLSWATATETNNDRFVVERKSETSNWSAVATAIGNGTSTERHEYSYMDNAISENETYYYRLKQVDYDGTFAYSKVVKVESTSLPTDFTLNQNYPNPFNPSTVISYSMPVDGAVKLVVTNVLGQEVKELVNGQQTAGSYKINFNAQGLTSGIYFYNLNVKSATGEVFNQVKKMMFVK